MNRAAQSILLLCLPLATPATAQTSDAQTIMRKVAANTDAAVDARRQYVYRQRVRSSLLEGNGKVVCKESREYTVVPQAESTERKLVSFTGECQQGNQMTPYSQPAVAKPGMSEKGGDSSIGRESIAAVMDDLAIDPHTRDGIPSRLFPLGSDELPNYKFTLKGETTLKGRRAYDIAFEPADRKGTCIDAGDDKSEHNFHVHVNTNTSEQEQSACRPWKGEVWIDAEDYQPIRIDTKLSKGVPWGVKVFLGTNIAQLGFSLTYQRVAEGVWFPATYGTEFHVQVLWGFKRTITMSMENSDFRKTDAQSTITFDQP